MTGLTSTHVVNSVTAAPAPAARIAAWKPRPSATTSSTPPKAARRPTTSATPARPIRSSAWSTAVIAELSAPNRSGMPASRIAARTSGS